MLSYTGCRTIACTARQYLPQPPPRTPYRCRRARLLSRIPVKHSYMGKDPNGKFVPPKGHPSGSGKESQGVSHSLDPDSIGQHLGISDKYTNENGEPAALLHVLHPNRDTHKKMVEQTDNEHNRGAQQKSKTAGKPPKS